MVVCDYVIPPEKLDHIVDTLIQQSIQRPEVEWGQHELNHNPIKKDRGNTYGFSLSFEPLGSTYQES